jgi:hypothetical protein
VAFFTVYDVAVGRWIDIPLDITFLGVGVVVWLGRHRGPRLAVSGGDAEKDQWDKLVEAQAELAVLPELELGRRMGELVMAAALRRPAATPRGVLRELLDDYGIDDEEWRETVSPELRRALQGRGVEFDEDGNVTPPLEPGA